MWKEWRGYGKDTLSLGCFLTERPLLQKQDTLGGIRKHFLTVLSSTWEKIQMPDSLLPPEGLCQHHHIDWCSKAPEESWGGCRAQPRRRNFRVHTPGSAKDLAVWPQVTELLRTLMGKAEFTTLGQPQRSCECNSSPVEKVLENKKFPCFVPVEKSLRPQSVTTGSLTCTSKREKRFWRANCVGPENNFLLV